MLFIVPELLDHDAKRRLHADKEGDGSKQTLHSNACDPGDTLHARVLFGARVSGLVNTLV